MAGDRQREEPMAREQRRGAGITRANEINEFHLVYWIIWRNKNSMTGAELDANLKPIVLLVAPRFTQKLAITQFLKDKHSYIRERSTSSSFW